MIKKKEFTDSPSLFKWVKIALVFFVGFIVFVLVMFGLVFALSSFFGINVPTEDIPVLGSERVALVKIDGEIVTEGSSGLFSDSAVVSSSDIVSYLEEIRDDSSIKGVIFEINSPGGSGVASDEIVTAIRDLNKPTVSYIREMGASGAYWVASSTDYIYTNKFAMVGSIGVISGWLDFTDLLTDFNVKYQRFVAGDNKDFGTPYRHITPQEEKRYQAQLDELHTLFIQQVAEGRGLSEAQVRKIADGFVFTGQGAVDNQLVDDIGGKKEAIAYMESVLGTTVDVQEYYYEPNIWDVFSSYSSSLYRNIGRGLGDVLFKEKSSLSIRT
jgi:protease-4